MVVCYNFQLIPESELQLSISNRAFQYNDGAFETMLYIDGKVRFLDSHLDRIQRAAKVLQIELPESLLEPETIAFWIEQLLVENQLTQQIRIKLKVWRSGNGLYTPKQNTAKVLITAEPQMKTSDIVQKADFAVSVQTNFSAYSFFKGPNSLQYVLAGIEKKQRQLEEIILLSSDGFISECLSSNIFWVKNGVYYTPAIETGCVAGIMRENLLRLFQAENIPFQEGNILPEELLKAETVFTSNVARIKVIQQLGEAKFSKKLPDWLTQKLTENHFI